MEKTKKTVAKKPVTKKETVKEIVKTNDVTVTNQIDYTKSLESISNLLIKIFYVLVVVGALLLVNICVNVVKNSNKANTTTLTTSDEEQNQDYDVSEFTTMTTSELDAEIKKGGTQVVYIGRSTCGYCVKFLPIMKQAQKDLNYTTTYVNLEEVTSADSEILTGYDSYVKENFGYTPMVLVFRDGKFVDGTVGYTDLDTFKSFLDKAGIN